MITIQIPGGNRLAIDHLVLDYNGTLAKDGKLLSDVADLLNILSDQLLIHVITADTFGGVEAELSQIRCKVEVLSTHRQDKGKLDYLDTLGKERTVAIGNGRNDCLMIQAAALGIAVIQEEGAWAGTLQAADVVCNSIVSALELLRHPSRLKATLRV
jgi:soluble P-type ATPase